MSALTKVAAAEKGKPYLVGKIKFVLAPRYNHRRDGWEKCCAVILYAHIYLTALGTDTYGHSHVLFEET